MTRLRRSFAAMILPFALFACADDAGDSAATADAGTADLGTAGDGDGDRPCEPVNADLESEADHVVDMELTDFSFDQNEYTVDAGITTFAVVNSGSVNHEVAFLPGGGDVPMNDGAPDEAALEAAGAFELEAFGHGLTCNATYDLEPGAYTVFCIVPIESGHTHYDEGMRATLVVT